MKNLLATYQRLYQYLRPYRSRYILALLITLPIGAMDGAIAWAIKPFMDQVLVGKNIGILAWVPVLIIGFNVVQGVLRYYEIYLNEYLAQKVTMGLRKDLFRKLQSMSMGYFHEQISGHLASRYYVDPSRVQRAVVATLRVMLTKAFTTITLAGVMLYHSWKLTLVAMGILSLIFIPITAIRRKLTDLAHKETESSARLVTLLNETFFGIRILRSFVAFSYQNRRFEAAQHENHRQIIKMAQIKGLLSPITHVISAVGISAIVWYGCYQVVSDQMTAGALMSFVVAMIMMYRPLKGLGNSVVDGQKALAAANRIFEILDSTDVLESRPDARPFNGINKAIEYRHVRFRYNPQGDWVLNDINLTIEKGETVAVVGGSGGGKTTLVELLMGLYPQFEGSITFDGVSIDEFDLNSLNRHIAYVSQDTLLFEGTLYDNVLLGNPQADEAAIHEAVDLAYLSEMVAQLPQGLHTPIGERGIKLSGGQRQRLAIARAILKNAPILILDEATSALDTESEACIQQALARLVQNRTVIMIAHRLSTIQKANRILVLEGGRIVEEGTHENLLDRPDSSYRRLYQAQFYQDQLVSA